MSSYDRIYGKLVDVKGTVNGDVFFYTLNYREDKPLPAFVPDRVKDLIFRGRAEVEWLADAAKNARDLTYPTGKGWVTHEGPIIEGKQSRLYVREYKTIIRDREDKRIELGWAGLDWIADDLAHTLMDLEKIEVARMNKLLQDVFADEGF